MEEHSWEPKPNHFDRSNLMDPSKFSDIYFHGNLFHRKREWQIPGYEKALTSLPFLPLFPSHQTVQNPTLRKPDGLLLVNDIIMYKATPTHGFILCLTGASNSDFDNLNSFLSMPKRQWDTQTCPFVRENMINLEQHSSLRSCLHCCLNICQIKIKTHFIKIQLTYWDFQKCFM